MEHAYYSQHNPDNVDDVDDMDDVDEIQCNNKTSDELLIDAVRGYPHLYDPSLKEYKDITMKENSWKEIALVMNMSVDNCQTRWLRLRERFTKEQRLQEIEHRSGSAASRRPIFVFYHNMMFLKNCIKRRKSYTNVTNLTVKRKTVDTSNISTKKPNFLENTSNNFLDTQGCYSNSSFTSNSDILSEEMEIAPTTNFLRNQRIQEINEVQTIQNTSSINRPRPCISQEISIIDTDSVYRTSPPLRSESNHNINKMAVCALTSNSPSPTLHTMPSSNTKNSGKIKNKSATHLESSITSLTNTLQNRLTNLSCPDNNNNAWNLNNLTLERSFGLLVALELERISEPEKSKRKQAIAEILWKPYIQ